jgi:uncharacterized delta-60 repeat protein
MRISCRSWLVLALTPAVAALVVVPAGAAAAGTGKVTTDFAGSTQDHGRAMALQPDGRIVVAGDSARRVALARYTAGGALDPTFGTGGQVITDLGTSAGQLVAAVAVLPGGGILVAGNVRRLATGGAIIADFLLLRYTAAGTLDPGFGSGGVVVTDLGSGSERAADVAVQPDGRILLAGSAGSGFSDFAILRYTAAGVLDPTFGTGGVVRTDFLGRPDRATAVQVQPDGRILAAGIAQEVVGNQAFGRFGLARYTAGGALDPTFGAGGKVVTAFPGITTGVEGLALQGDGRIVAAGTLQALPGTAGSVDAVLARYTTAGTLDPTFGTGGTVRTGFAGQDETLSDVGIRPDGRIVASGDSSSFDTTFRQDFLLLQYQPGGALDPAFGTGGRVTTDFNNARDMALAGALQPDGRLLVAGDSLDLTVGGDFALARYTTTGGLDTSFG